MRFTTRRVGLLLDGDEVIAKFRMFTGEDCHGGRKFSDFAIDVEGIHHLRETMYPSEGRDRPKVFRAMYLEYNLEAGPGAPGRLIEDFGFQCIVGMSIREREDRPGFEVNVKAMKCQNPNMKISDNQKPQLLLSGWYGYDDTGRSRHSVIARLRHLRSRQIF